MCQLSPFWDKSSPMKTQFLPHLDIEGDVLGVADDDDVEVEVGSGHHGRPGGGLASC